MKILSWDVGIYNLCYCILEKKDEENNEPKIIGWDIVNLVDNEKMKKNRNLLFENIPRKLNEIPQLLDVDIVVIENQPSLKNPQMKSIQMILYSYFLILGKVIGNETTKCYIDTIDFCSASNKLKVYNGPKIDLTNLKSKSKKKNNDINIDIEQKQEIKNENCILPTNNNEYVVESEDENENKTIKKETKKTPTLKYSDKKKIAVEHTKYFLEKYNNEYIQFFNSHKKKDDLSDSYLQGLYYIEQLNKKNK
jgi:hypothetical protein